MTKAILAEGPTEPLDGFGVQYYPMRFMHSLSLHRSSEHCTGGGCWHCWYATAVAEILFDALDYALLYPDLHDRIRDRMVKRKRLALPEAHLLAGPAIWRTMAFHPFSAFRWVGMFAGGTVAPLSDELQATVHRVLQDHHLLEAFPGVPVVGQPSEVR